MTKEIVKDKSTAIKPIKGVAKKAASTEKTKVAEKSKTGTKKVAAKSTLIKEKAALSSKAMPLSAKEVKPKSAAKGKAVTTPKSKELSETKAKTAKISTAKTATETKEKTVKTKKLAKKFADSELELIIEKMQDMKAHNLVSMDLRNVPGSSFDYFVIAHAPSSTQVAAIAESVEDLLREKMSLRAWHTEGYQNAEWILLDYGSIVVHVFREEVRTHFRLEDLWGDAVIVRHDSEN